MLHSIQIFNAIPPTLHPSPKVTKAAIDELVQLMASATSNAPPKDGDTTGPVTVRLLDVLVLAGLQETAEIRMGRDHSGIVISLIIIIIIIIIIQN